MRRWIVLGVWCVWCAAARAQWPAPDELVATWGSDPVGTQVLAAWLVHRYDFHDPDRLRAVLDALRKTKTSGAGEVRARLLWVAARLAAATGDLDGAARAVRDAGFVSRWTAVGPYVGRDALRRPPRPDAACIPAPHRTTCTLDVRSAPADAIAWFSPLFGDLNEQCVAVQTRTVLPADTTVHLQYGTVGASTVWWDERAIFADPRRYNGMDPLRHALRFPATAGPHLLTIEICADHTGQAAVAARLADRDGRPLATSPPSAPFPVSGAVADGTMVDDTGVLARLRNRRARGDADAALWAPLFAAATGATADNDTWPADAARELCLNGDVRGCLLWDELAVHSHERLAATAAALRLAPDGPDAAAAWIGARLDLDTIPIARIATEATRLARRFPQSVSIGCTRLYAWRAAGFPTLTAHLADALVARFPRIPMAAWCAYDATADAPPDTNTPARLQRAARWYADAPGLYVAMHRVFVQRSDDEKLADADRLAQVAPFAVEDRLELLESLVGSSRSETALARIDRLCRAFPGFAQCHGASAQWHLAHGHPRRALASLHRLRAAVPNDSWARRARFHIARAPDPAAAYVPPVSWDTAPHEAGILSDTTVVHVDGSGRTRSARQVVVRPKDAPKEVVADLATITYEPGYAYAFYRTALWYRSEDHAALPLTDIRETQLSEPWFDLYYDVRALAPQIPSFAPEDAFAFAYAVEDQGSTGHRGAFFGTVVPVRHPWFPTRRWRYVIIASPDRRVHVSAPAFVHRRLERLNGRDAIVLEAADLPAFSVDPGAFFAVKDNLLRTSTHDSWEELGRWYARFIAPQLVPDAAMRHLVARLTADARDDRDKVAAIYRFVTDAVRYVGLEFGVHAYRPYPVSQVLTRRYGDCKDTASVLVAMLGLAGVPARVALVRTRDLGDAGVDFPSLELFNHAIVYVPRLGLWLDGTTDHHELGELPFGDQGVAALVADAGDPAALRTATLPAADNFVRTRWRVVPHKNRLRITGTISLFGSPSAPQMRSALEAAPAATVVQDALSRRFPGVAVRRATVRSAGRPVTVSFTAEAPGRRGRFSLGRWLTGALADQVAPAARRAQDADIGPRRVMDETWIFPGTWRPETGALGDVRSWEKRCADAVTVRLSVEHTRDGTKVRRTARIDRVNVDAATYTALAACLAAADNAVALHLVREGAAR